MNKFIAPVELSKAFRLINHGPTTLVSARHAGVDNVMSASWVCALDYSPPKLTVVLDKMAKTRELIEKTGQFVIQVPTVAQLKLTHYAGTHSLHDDPDKMAHADARVFSIPGNDLPFIEGCSGWLACTTLQADIFTQQGKQWISAEKKCPDIYRQQSGIYACLQAFY